MLKRDNKRRFRLNSRKIIYALLILLLVYTLSGFLLVPRVARAVVQKKLTEKLHRTVTINAIRLNPFNLSLQIEDFSLTEKNSYETFFHFDDLYLTLRFSSLFRRALLMKRVHLERPYFHLVRESDNVYNFADLMGGGKDSGSSPLRFSLANITIARGRIYFKDKPEKIAHVVDDIHINLPVVSNLPYYEDVFIKPYFGAVVNKTQVFFAGRTKPFHRSLETSFDINIDRARIPYYLTYVPFPLKFKMPSGDLTTRLKVFWMQYADKKPDLLVSGGINIDDIVLASLKDEPVFTLPGFDVDISSMNIFSREITCSRISLESPEFWLSRDETGSLNIGAFLPEKKKAVEKKETVSPFSIRVKQIAITEGKLYFSDANNGRLFRNGLSPFNFNMDDFSTVKDEQSSFNFTASTQLKETIKAGGVFSINPIASRGSLEINGVTLNKYSPYYDKHILFEVENGGVDISGRYKYTGEGIAFSDISLELKSLSLCKGGEQPFLSVPVFSLEGTGLDIKGRKLALGTLESRDGFIRFQRTESGKLDILPLLPSGEQRVSTTEPEIKPGNAKPWLFSAADVEINGYTIKGEDKIPTEDVRFDVSRVHFEAKDISTEKNHRCPFSLALLLNEKGQISLDGKMGIKPFSLSFVSNLKDISVGPFHGYLTDRMNIMLTGGTVSSSGDFSMVTRDGKPGMTYEGDVSIDGLSSTDEKGDPFLNWKNMDFTGLRFGSNPDVFELNTILLSDFYCGLVINDDRTTNIKTIFKNNGTGERDTEAQPEKKEQTEKKMPVSIGHIVLKSGEIEFIDRSIQPNYTATLKDFEGDVSGISSLKTQPGTVSMNGKLYGHSPIEITGKIKPLAEDLFVDLKVSFNDIDLTSTSPYSGKYLGYVTDKGKLTLNLEYLITKRKLDSQNRILLDQYTLGEKVESADATKLPVKFALALLRDVSGQIQLNLPVSGSLDDPKFRIGQIIIKVLLNIITKAVTSPFKLLGTMFGGGEDISYVEFDYGGSEINEDGLKKIDTIIKAMQNRPGINLEIKSFVDREKDAEQLRNAAFDKRLKAQKLREITGKGEPSVSIEDVTIEQEEYQTYLWLAYKAEDMPKPRNILGFVKALPVEEMEQKIMGNIKIQESDLLFLAQARSLAVKDYLLTAGKIEQGRIFLAESRILSGEEKAGVKASRVEFGLK